MASVQPTLVQARYCRSGHQSGICSQILELSRQKLPWNSRHACAPLQKSGASSLAAIGIYALSARVVRQRQYRRLGSLIARRQEYIEDTRTSRFGPQCGDELMVSVTAIRDCGAFCSTKDGVEAYLPLGGMGRPKEDYEEGMELKVTVTRPALPNKRKDEVMVTDRAMQPLSALVKGMRLEGKVVNVDKVGVLLEIGFPVNARCWHKHLYERKKDSSAWEIGDTLRSLKVLHRYPTWVQVMPAEMQLRPLRDMKVGERLEGMVVRTSPKAQGVFLDVNGTENVGAFVRTGNLAKSVADYKFGEVLHVEVIENLNGRVYVKQLKG